MNTLNFDQREALDKLCTDVLVCGDINNHDLRQQHHYAAYGGSTIHEGCASLSTVAAGKSSKSLVQVPSAVPSAVAAGGSGSRSSVQEVINQLIANDVRSMQLHHKNVNTNTNALTSTASVPPCNSQPHIQNILSLGYRLKVHEVNCWLIACSYIVNRIDLCDF